MAGEGSAAGLMITARRSAYRRCRRGAAASFSAEVPASASQSNGGLSALPSRCAKRVGSVLEVNGGGSPWLPDRFSSRARGRPRRSAKTGHSAMFEISPESFAAWRQKPPLRRSEPSPRGCCSRVHQGLLAERPPKI